MPVCAGFFFAACSGSKSKPETATTEARPLVNQSATPAPPDSASPALSPMKAEGANEGVLVIQGIFDPTGTKLVELKPVRHYARVSGPLPNQTQGRFVVRVLFAHGGVTNVYFDALVADDSASGGTVHGFFEVTVPAGGEVESIRITDAADQKTFARIAGPEIQR